MRSPAIRPFVASLASAALVLLLSVSPGVGERAGAGHEVPPVAEDTLRATVQGVYPEASEIRLVTGVGLSLRTIRVHAPAETSVRVGGEEAGLDALRRGQVVAVVLGEAPEGLGLDPGVRVAASIRVVGPGDGGSAPGGRR